MRYLDRPARLVCPASSIGDLSANPIPYRETRGRGMGDQYPFWQEATPGVIFFSPETSTYRCEDDRVGTTEQRMEDGVYGDLGTHSDRERERERGDPCYCRALSKWWGKFFERPSKSFWKSQTKDSWYAWVEEVGGKLHPRDTGSVTECISTSTDVIDEYGAKYKYIKTRGGSQQLFRT